MKRVRSVIIPVAIGKAMQAERSKHLPRETGGFLLGLRRGESIEVSEFTPQSTQDQADASSFERIDPDHQRRATKAWVRANGLVGLIGDWHTHPFGAGTPSSADKAAWCTLIDAMDAPGIGIIVVDNELCVFAFREGWSGLRVKRLHSIANDRDDFVFCESRKSDARSS